MRKRLKYWPSGVNLERCGATCARTKCQMCNFVGGTNFKNCYKEQNCESVFLARGRYFLTGRVALTLNVVVRPAPGRFVKNVNTGVNHAPARASDASPGTKSQNCPRTKMAVCRQKCNTIYVNYNKIENLYYRALIFIYCLLLSICNCLLLSICKGSTIVFLGL